MRVGAQVRVQKSWKETRCVEVGSFAKKYQAIYRCVISYNAYSIDLLQYDAFEEAQKRNWTAWLGDDAWRSAFCPSPPGAAFVASWMWKFLVLRSACRRTLAHVGARWGRLNKAV